MADDSAGDGVPEPVRERLAGLAEGSDVDEQGRHEPVGLGPLRADGGELGAAELQARLEEVEAALEGLQDELDEKVDDVRDRVIQVKRETDAKAAADHDHAALEERVDRLDGQLDALGRDYVDVDAAVDDVEERLDVLEGRMEAGFSNFEEVLEYLLDAADDADAKRDTLARAVLDLRRRVDRLASSATRRDAADRLRASAHEHGVTSADCESCGRTVHLAMLTAPECPHCAAGFTEVEPRTGFFRSSVLHTGSRPALEGAVQEEAPDVSSLLEEAGAGSPEVGDADSATDAAGPADAAGVADAGPAGNAAASRGLDAVRGVGPAYAEQLRDAGVGTVGELAVADTERLADGTDIAAGRLRTLVDRARELVDDDGPTG